MYLRLTLAAWLQKVVHALDGSRFGYDEFDHGFREGIKSAQSLKTEHDKKEGSE